MGERIVLPHKLVAMGSLPAPAFPGAAAKQCLNESNRIDESPYDAVQVATEPPQLLLQPHRPLPNPSLHARPPRRLRYRLLHRRRQVRLRRAQDLADARLTRNPLRFLSPVDALHGDIGILTEGVDPKSWLS
ncbi:unnamed protein product [Sphenostylis stenocarpa]|uniref:Uncharacterized protein n=1 Tax=Sphenostylis stenocarpa TaxID=92480 RepID=A0AA86V938_9FABA|nr:unnamed protein product [Sphenostylis stenocarpa]